MQNEITQVRFCSRGMIAAKEQKAMGYQITEKINLRTSGMRVIGEGRNKQAIEVRGRKNF